MSIEGNQMDGPDGASLEPQFAVLRQEIKRMTAPVSVERSLLAQFRARRSVRPSSPWWRQLTLQFLLPAVALGAAVVLSLPFLLRIGLPAELGNEAEETGSAIAPFYALASGGADVSADDATVIATELSSQTLEDFGLPVDPAAAGKPVAAEVLVGRTGEIIAVRLADQSEQQQ